MATYYKPTREGKDLVYHWDEVDFIFYDLVGDIVRNYKETTKDAYECYRDMVRKMLELEIVRDSEREPFEAKEDDIALKCTEEGEKVIESSAYGFLQCISAYDGSYTSIEDIDSEWGLYAELREACLPVFEEAGLEFDYVDFDY